MKSLPWFRFYVDVLNNFKVQRLSGQAFKNWVNCLCLAAKGGGILPPLPEIAFALRMSESEAKAAIEELQAARLLDQTEAGLMPHNWLVRQYQSDSSAARTRKYRERKRHRDVTVTAPDTEQIQNRRETETEQNRFDRGRDSRLAGILYMGRLRTQAQPGCCAGSHRGTRTGFARPGGRVLQG